MAVSIIETEALGKVSWTKFNKMVKAHNNNQAALARTLGVSPSVVRTWKMRLNRKRQAMA